MNERLLRRYEELVEDAAAIGPAMHSAVLRWDTKRAQELAEEAQKITDRLRRLDHAFVKYAILEAV